MQIDSLKKSTTLESAIDGIGRFIVDNKLSPGDRLPSETEFSEAFCIRRNIVREAFRHYRTLGVITSKPKTGPVVKNLLPDNPYAGYFPFLAAQKDIFTSLVELRIAIESGAARFISANATAEQTDTLRRLLEEMETAEPVKHYELDTEFHVTLLKAANNPLLTGLVPLLVQFFSEQHRRNNGGAFHTRPHREVLKEHRAMVDAVVRRDAAALQTLLELHSDIYLQQTENGDKNAVGK